MVSPSDQEPERAPVRARRTAMPRPTRVFRIGDSRHPLLDGTGAAQHGGRWNSRGVRVIYTSLTYAGALLERLAQVGRAHLPRRQVWIGIDLPPGAPIEEVAAADLPGWDAPGFAVSRAFGDRWHEERRSLALVVPSIVGRPNERNVVFNQDHAAFEQLTATPPESVIWDVRLFPPGLQIG